MYPDFAKVAREEGFENIAQVFEANADMEKYNEVGPNEEYSAAVTPMIQEFGLAMTYEVSKATPLPLTT